MKKRDVRITSQPVGAAEEDSVALITATLFNKARQVGESKKGITKTKSQVLKTILIK